jgi:hypothetical protein
LAADTHFIKHLIEEEEVEHGVLLLNRFGLQEEEEEEFRTQTNNNNNNNLFRVRVSNYNDDMKQATKHTLLPRKTRIGSRIFQLPNSQNAVFYVRTSANAILDNTQSLSHR